MNLFARTSVKTSHFCNENLSSYFQFPSAPTKSNKHFRKLAGIPSKKNSRSVLLPVRAILYDGADLTLTNVGGASRRLEPAKKTILDENAPRDYGSGVGTLYGTPKRGTPIPYGPTAVATGVNFVIQSSGAMGVTLCLFTEESLELGITVSEIPLHPTFNCTGNTWHIFLPNLVPNLLYGYRMDGPYEPTEGHWFDSTKIMLDPYAKGVVTRGRSEFGQTSAQGETWTQLAGIVPSLSDGFDWEGDSPPGLHLKDLIIYEMHVRGFTKHESSGVQFPGTFLGVVEKLHKLKELGINAIELLPVQEFNELEYYSYNSYTEDFRVNFWGYSTINYFSPMSRYSSFHLRGESGKAAEDSGSQFEFKLTESNAAKAAVREFKEMVKEAHRLGIEVILDVVLNHTSEGNEQGVSVSFRGVDNITFYMIAPQGQFYNYSGCGNTLNCNHPFVRNFIVDCLRYWVTEMHVDGFRFDLASILTRASSNYDLHSAYGLPASEPGDLITTGTPLSDPPLIDMISNDPILGKIKLIAEAWDASGLYQVGAFPHYGKWAEWNGQFRDSVRQFIKGSDGFAGKFADVICGSAFLYQAGGRSPFHSINFFSAHDGFTLRDLCSYNEKQNEANGEDNRDGENHNLSWNCGVEGETEDPGVLCLRERQMRNLLVALFVAQGVPMLLMGDEYGHSKNGNNNTYCHDSALNYLNWSAFESGQKSGLTRFVTKLIKLRKSHNCLRSYDFPNAEWLTWHGVQPFTPDWSETNRLVAFSLINFPAEDEPSPSSPLSSTAPAADYEELYIAFNTSHLPLILSLPDCRLADTHSWFPVVDTSKPGPYDYADQEEGRDSALLMEGFLSIGFYPLLSYSALVLKAVRNSK